MTPSSYSCALVSTLKPVLRMANLDCFEPFSNVVGHSVSQTGSNQSKFNDEWIKVRRGATQMVANNLVFEFVANFCCRFRDVDSVQKCVAVSALRMCQFLQRQLLFLSNFKFDKKFF